MSKKDNTQLVQVGNAVHLKDREACLVLKADNSFHVMVPPEKSLVVMPGSPDSRATPQGSAALDHAVMIAHAMMEPFVLDIIRLHHTRLMEVFNARQKMQEEAEAVAAKTSNPGTTDDGGSPRLVPVAAAEGAVEAPVGGDDEGPSPDQTPGQPDTEGS